jgi:hypothetical protein
MKSVACLLTIVLLSLCAGTASGMEKDGVSYPDEITVEGTPLTLNGLGTREATIFQVNVYVAALYLENPSSDGYAICASQEVKRLILHFVRDVGESDIAEAWAEGFMKNAGDDLESFEERIITLNSWMTQMRDGEEMSFTYFPDRGLEVSVKGTVMGTIEGSDFAGVFFSIWLGDDPPNGGLRDGLLGLD